MQLQCSHKPLLRLDSRHIDPKKPSSSFVTTNSKKLFAILELRDSFRSLPPESWVKNDDYCYSASIVRALKVTNDTTERAVKLMQDYNTIIPNDEEQKQFLL